MRALHQGLGDQEPRTKSHTGAKNPKSRTKIPGRWSQGPGAKDQESRTKSQVYIYNMCIYIYIYIDINIYIYICASKGQTPRAKDQEARTESQGPACGSHATACRSQGPRAGRPGAKRPSIYKEDHHACQGPRAKVQAPRTRSQGPGSKDLAGAKDQEPLQGPCRNHGPGAMEQGAREYRGGDSI